ncbi:putative Ras-related protein Rab-33 [Hydractinia symbiolongicarpus]|uniref:putative Ras-related protein Rab-33 n=1 Tax=Hydractinia symbiolongicarpus TaxID=13093 RepID=UPI00254CD605|nr:putative Ras-related protein Rab-33 [Hydractinia symbiolongicarpus]
MADADDYDYLYKVVVIGDTNVGKTSILTRFCCNSFTEKLSTTIGVDFQAISAPYGHSSFVVFLYTNEVQVEQTKDLKPYTMLNHFIIFSKHLLKLNILHLLVKQILYQLAIFLPKNKGERLTLKLSSKKSIRFHSLKS